VTSRDANEHPTAEFDELVHQPNRLAILVVLREAGRADFGYLKATLDLTDGNLGRHLTALADAGMVKIEKGYKGRRPRTWATITASGRRALTREIRAMERLVRRVHD